MTNELYAADSIDLGLVAPEEFEKLIYFLLDEMGMKNIEWRKGGSGISATDGGRDLECDFYMLCPDGAMRKERWWIEVKHRNKTLETSKIQKAIWNAQGVPDLDVIAIATNANISTKARDWIKSLKVHPKRVIVWEGHNVEKLIYDHPTIIYKFFPNSLTLKARLKAVHQRFLSQLVLPSISDLSDFWKHKKSLEFTIASVLAIVFAENASGDLFKRKWGLWLPVEYLAECLALGFRNSVPWSLKCKELGRFDNFLIDGLSYLLQCLLLRVDAEVVRGLIEESFKVFDHELRKPVSKNLSRYMLKLVLNNCLIELSGACSQDCPKLKFFYNEVNRKKLFAKFDDTSFYKMNDDDDDGLLYYLSTKAECRIGLIATGDWCPFALNSKELLKTDEKIMESLKFIKEVLVRNTRHD